MPLRVILAAVVTATAAVACFGGDKESSEGQDDYLDRYVEITSEFNRLVGEFECRGYFGDDCDREALAEALEVYIDEWEDLDAPQAIRAAEAARLDTARRLVEFLPAPTEQAVERAAELPGLALAGDREEDWEQAIEEYYDVRLFMFEGASMHPAFCDGDTVAIESPEGPIQRWAVIVFEFPVDRERTFAKRVVGLPGETIAVRDETIFIDGAPVEGDTYALASPNYVVEPPTIPEGRYYVLGDNRRNSFDSHQWAQSSAGPVETDSTVPHEYILGVLQADVTTCPTDPDA
jgi:signal peptidase I